MVDLVEITYRGSYGNQENQITHNVCFFRWVLLYFPAVLNRHDGKERVAAMILCGHPFL